MPMPPLIDDEPAWAAWRRHWSIRWDTTYLNHGSFGPTPPAVLDAQQTWRRCLCANPMDFLIRGLDDELLSVRESLAAFVGAATENLVLVDNATYGMNIVANSVSLSAGDEVLLTDHEYGAVRRIWQRECDRADARLRTIVLPAAIESTEQVVDAIAGAFTPRTRLLVVSHITSPTAITLPVAQIVRRARDQNIPVCIDGPHAVAQLSLDIEALDCDFYTASCHKWLSAPLGTGFLYVNPRWQESIQPPILSWGKSHLPEASLMWQDEFDWLGTRDPSAFLAIPSAIALLKRVGLDVFRARTHFLASYARERITQLVGLQPLMPDDVAWYGSMAHVPLPNGDARQLQNALWAQHGIEVPIIDFNGRRWIRVSCHLYTQKNDINVLIDALRDLL